MCNDTIALDHPRLLRHLSHSIGVLLELEALRRVKELGAVYATWRNCVKAGVGCAVGDAKTGSLAQPGFERRPAK